MTGSFALGSDIYTACTLHALAQPPADINITFKFFRPFFISGEDYDKNQVEDKMFRLIKAKGSLL